MDKGRAIFGKHRAVRLTEGYLGDHTMRSYMIDLRTEEEITKPLTTEGESVTSFINMNPDQVCDLLFKTSTSG